MNYSSDSSNFYSLDEPQRPQQTISQTKLFFEQFERRLKHQKDTRNKDIKAILVESGEKNISSNTPEDYVNQPSTQSKYRGVSHRKQLPAGKVVPTMPPRRGRSISLLQIMREKTSARSDIATIDAVNLVNEIRCPPSDRQNSETRNILASKIVAQGVDDPLKPFEVNQARYQDRIQATIQAIRTK